MSKIYYFILCLCCVFFLFNDFSLFQKTIYDALDESVDVIIDLGLLIVLWNGLFNILIDSKFLNKIGFIFKRYFRFLYPNIEQNSEEYDYLVLNFLFNLLGMGIGGMSSSLKVINKFKENDNIKDIEKFIILNIGCFTFVPISLIGYLLKYDIKIGIPFLICSFLVTTFVHLFSVLIVKVFYK